METFLLCINAVIPIFVFIAVGYFCQLIGVIKRDSVPKFNTIAFNVFLTALCFSSVYNSDLSLALDFELIAFAGLWTIGVFLICTAIFHFSIKKEDEKGVMTQGVYRSNFLMVGLQLALGLGGQDVVAVIAMISIIIIPLNNILAVITLSMHGAQKTDWKHTTLKILKNPLIIATLIALVLVVLGIQLPKPLVGAITQMGNASTPLMLFLLGAFFQFRTLGKYKLQLAVAVVGRLVIAPAIVLGCALLLGFRGIALIALMALFASSTANASFTMAQQLEGNAELAGDIVALTSAVCPFTLFAWSYAFMSLGFI